MLIKIDMAHVEKREYWSQAKKPDGTTKRKRLKRWFVIAEDSNRDGKRKRKSLGGFDTKREAERAMPELLRKFYSREMDQTKETFKEYIDRYLEQRDPKINPGKKHTLKRRTHQDYKQMLNRYSVPLMGNKQLSALTANDFDDVYQHMHDKGLRFSSIRKMHATCHKVMADAVRDRLIQSNPTDRCMNVPSTSAVKEQQEQWREKYPLWTSDQLKQFLDKTKDHRYWLMWYMSAMTGMRPAEVCGLRWHDINFDDQSLRVAQQIVDVAGVKEYDTPKTANSKRRITLDDKTVKLLWKFREKQIEIIEAMGWEDTGLVFINTKGTSISPNSYGAETKATIERVGLPHNKLYDLRHLHTTLLISSGVDIKTVSMRAGHASVSFTLDVYVKTVDENERAAASALANRIFG